MFPDRRRGGYRGKVPVGKYPNGKTRYREVWGATLAECVAAKKRVLPPGPETTVAEWCDRWLAESGARSTTLHDYRATVENHVKPRLGGLRVCDVTPADVEACVRSWRVGANTAKKNAAILRAVLEGARRAGLCASNPADAARRPKGAKVDSRPLPAADLARVVAAAEGPLALIAAIGCRLGESLALDVQDFDAAAGTVRITQTYSQRHGLGPVKSENGRRTVRVPAPALPALLRAAGGRKSGPLFLGRGGGRVADPTVRAQFNRLLASLGLAPRPPHQLRHSVATALVSAGTPLGDVARFLGDSVRTVVATYLHPAGSDPAGVLEGLLGCGKVAPKAAKRGKSP